MKIPQGRHDRHTNLPRPMTPEEFAKTQQGQKTNNKRKQPKLPKPKPASIIDAPGKTSAFKFDRSREWKAWTTDEKTYLRRAVAQGEEMRLMRIHLKRSDGRILYQMRKLGLSK
jgi:hypothetical protein